MERDWLSALYASLMHILGRGLVFYLTKENVQITLKAEAGTAIDWERSIISNADYGSIMWSDGGRFFRALTGIDIDVTTDEDELRWPLLQAAVIARMSKTPLAGLDSLTRKQTPVAAQAIALKVIVASDRHAFSLHALASAETWLAFFRKHGWEQVRNDLEHFLDVLLVFPVLVARHAVPLNVCNTIMGGDVIVPSLPNFRTDGEGVFFLAGARAHVCINAFHTLTINSVKNKMTNDDHNKHESGLAHVTADVEKNPEQEDEQIAYVSDALEVPLDFVLGHVQITLGELRSLGARSVLTIHDGSPDAISIRSRGVALGMGELVDVDGQLGIRVTHWRNG